MNRRATLLFALIALLHAGIAQAGVSASEAQQLGKTLTPFGAEQASNKAGTIPAYTGGLPTDTALPGFKPGSGRWTTRIRTKSPCLPSRPRNRVQVFTFTGTLRFLRTHWGTHGTGDGQFSGPLGLAVDGSGNVYVADQGNNRVQMFRFRPRPDGEIRVWGDHDPYVGDDIYNTTGTSQTSSRSTTGGGTVTYQMSVQNDARYPEALRLKGTASSGGFTVKYSHGSTGITNGVTAGTYTTPVLAPGATFSVKVQVTVTNTAPTGSSLSATLRVKSNTDPTIKDAVRFITSRP